MTHPSLTRCASFWFAIVGGAVASAQDAGARPARILPAPTPQQQSQAELQNLRDQKLHKPVFGLAAWRTDLPAACQEARQTGKLLFVYFTRSYAH